MVPFDFGLAACRLACLAGLALIAFHDALSFSQFTFDDHLAVENNLDAHSGPAVPFWDIFGKDFWGKWLTDRSSHRSYRPLTVASYRLEHWAAGGTFNVGHMFWANVALHVLCTWLVLFVLSRSLGNAVGFNAAALFAVHPVHCEAVAGLVGRSELLSCAAGLAGTMCIQRSLVTGAIICFLVAVLCKDSAVVFCGLYALHAAWEYLRGRASSAQLRQLVALSVALGVLALGARFVLMHGAVDLAGSGLLRHVENPHHFIADATHRWLYLLVLQWKNAELLFAPTQLCAEYSFNCIPQLPANPSDDPRLAPMLAGTVLVAALVLWCTRDVVRRCMFFSPDTGVKPESICEPLLFSLLLLFIPYSPVSHLFVTVGTLIAERCLYVPSIGACALVAVLIHFFTTQQRALSVAAILVSGLLFVTVRRVPDWSSDFALFKSAVDVCPNSAKNHQQFALTLYNAKRFDEGAAHLWRAHAIDPNFGEPLYHLARYYLLTQPDEALKLARQCSAIAVSAVTCMPFYFELRDKLRNMSSAEKQLDTVELHSDRALQAHHMRQSGLSFLQEKKQPCLATRAFLGSLRARAELGIAGLLEVEEVAPIAENNYCNTAYWASTAMSQCSNYSVDDLAELAANVTTGFCKFNRDAYEAAVRRFGANSLQAVALGPELVTASNIIALLIVNKSLAKALASPHAATVLGLHRCGSVAETLLAVSSSHEAALSSISHRLIPAGNVRESVGTLRHVAVQVLSNCMKRVSAAPKTAAAMKVMRLASDPSIRSQVDWNLRKQGTVKTEGDATP